jgi:cytoskeletal protein RodZ
MSGVAKDENPNSSSEEATPIVSGPAPADTSAPAADASAEPAQPPSVVREADTVVKLNLDKLNGEKASARKSHLRVVTDNQLAAAASSAAAPEIPTQRMGAVIRQAREALGYDLEQVSKETRITVSHLKAIEDMTPNLIGEPVYVKGHVRTYARHLKLDADAVLERYLKECAILNDPRKVEMAPPKVDRRMPVALPVLGILVVALAIGGGAFAILSSNGSQPATPAAKAVSSTAAGSASAAQSPSSVASAGPAVQNAADTLTIVALKRARLEVRGANGDSYRARYFSPGERYAPRVGAGWTVTTPDGSAFEWRRGDVSLGLLAPQGGPVYAQSVDLALQRVAIVGDMPDPAPAAAPSAVLPDANAPLVPGAAARPAAPRPVKPRSPAVAPSATTSAPAPGEKPVAPAASPSKDPALAAYPDQ